MKQGCGRVEGGLGGAVQGSRDLGYREVIMFFSLYLRMWNNTVMILFSRTELCASKQYYFVMSVLLSLFVCSARIMFSGWGEGPSATWVFTCFHLNPLSSVNTTGMRENAAEPKHYSAPINLFLDKLFTGWAPVKIYSFLVQCVPPDVIPVIESVLQWPVWSIVVIPPWQKERVEWRGTLRGKQGVESGT